MEGRMMGLIKKSVSRLRELGLRNLWQRVHAYVHDIACERNLGIETANWLEWVDVESNSQCMNYEPLPYWHIKRILSALHLTPGVDVFLDYGSGKGRAVVVAALVPLKRVVGVELLNDLSLVAIDNINSAASRLKCSDVEIETVDAADYVLPSDVTHIFLFNPFHGSVLQAVLGQVRESWLQHPRKITIAYILPPTLENLLDECDWLKSPQQLPLPHWQGLLFFVYTTADHVQMNHIQA